MSLDAGSITNLTKSPKKEKCYKISKDGKKIIFERRMSQINQDIYCLDVEGGTQTNLTNSHKAVEYFYDISQDQKSILYLRYNYLDQDPNTKLWIMDINGNNKRMLLSGKDEKETDVLLGRGIFSPSGRIFYTRDFFEYEYDPDEGEEKVVQQNREIYSIDPNNVGDNQRVTYTEEEDESLNDVNETKLLFIITTWEYDDEGKPTKIKDIDQYISNHYGGGRINLTYNTPYCFDGHGQFLKDGSEIIFSEPGSDYEIYIMNKDGTNIRQLTNNDVDDIEPTFSPDGTTIAYNSNNNIYTMKPDGTNQKKITEGRSPKFSPDGNNLAFLYGNTLYTTNLVTGDLTKIGDGIKAISWSCGSVENKAPIPIIIGTLTGYEGIPITLDGSLSYDLDGTITMGNFFHFFGGTGVFCDHNVFSYEQIFKWLNDYTNIT